MFIPFPFPSAQLAVFFVINLIWAIPLMLTQYVNDPWLGAMLAFFAVTCFSGMHEVARELENPFKNVPNEIPLCTLLAQYNESLLTMYYGFHPDHFWNADHFTVQRGNPGTQASRHYAASSETASKPPFASPIKTAEGIARQSRNGTTHAATAANSASSKQQSAEDWKLEEMQATIAKQSRELQELREMIQNASQQNSNKES
jgi:hypothetical protein